MGSRHRPRRRMSILSTLAAVALLLGVAKAASTTQVIYSFLGDTDGEYADTDLVTDSAGNIYGSTVQGGTYASGTVFQVTPAGVHTVLYSFTGGADGGEPYKGVTLDAQGNIYGTAGVGGKYVGPCSDTGCGTVFKLTNNGGSWTYSVIHSFIGGKDGWGPGSGVTVDSHGAVYGTTPLGGTSNAGVIYQLINASGTWKEKIVHTFTGGNDGLGGSAGRLLPDRRGGFYGACTAGGANGSGVIFHISPGTGGAWKFATLYAFKGMPDAGFPYGGLLLDKSGNLYGTTYYDGANDLGSVYELINNHDGTWGESVLYSFKGGLDGDGPISNLVFDSAGNLYGTTSDAGAPSCECGTIFKLAPGGGGTWTESVVYRFLGPPDGSFVYNGMVVDSAGNYYGATVHGGTANEGSIYKFVP